MHRFFLTQSSLRVGEIVDLTPLAHQLSVVLRLQSGAQIVLLDGQGQQFIAEIQQSARKQLQGLILRTQAAGGEPAIPLTLYQCSLKADKFEWVLQKGVELGVARFVPVISQRSVVRPAAALLRKYDRWQSILREAAEQCGRGRLPILAEPLTWDAALAQAPGLRLLPWEETAATQKGLMHYLAAQPAENAISLLIGPEGGLAPAEVTAAQQAGWQVVSLGPRILRAETAALASITLVMASRGEMG